MVSLAGSKEPSMISPESQVQQVGSMETLHMRFDLELSYNAKANPVSWQVAELTITDLGGSVHKYPIQVAVYSFENSDEQESNHPAAMKVSWSEKSRPREKSSERLDIATETIPQGCKADKVDPLFAARDPVFVLLSVFKPIATVTSLLEMEVLNAFLALIYGHAILWSIGVEHGDISEGNLMFDDKDKKPKLCDFDLSHVRGRDRPSGHSNTGTGPSWLWSCLPKRPWMERYPGSTGMTFESFIAVLVWVVFRYCNGKPVPGPPLEEWAQDHFVCCAANRKHTFDQIAERSLAGPAWLSPAMWEVICRAVSKLRMFIDRCRALASDILDLERDAGTGGQTRQKTTTILTRMSLLRYRR
ncbi:hypothetical protein DFP72DRAFT_1178655 [Ephemerocybe angulata]|uniref:Fungal-type protein kinase domain-containing protein n=1 Tax=Ephemerocybe angulata TaxID=980116 RepID=A0A8H6LTA4_9AGAR|nr:hypothetical protein DFP72DRAFT_1178655 [Tulosesus angulatus]